MKDAYDLQRRYGLTYKEARVYLAGSGKGVNARLAEEFGVGVHAIYNLRRRARQKIEATCYSDDDAAEFCDINPDWKGADPIESPTLNSIFRTECTMGYVNDYTMDMFRLQELAGLSFIEAQVYLCSIDWEPEEAFRERTAISAEEFDELLKSAREKVSAAESDGESVLLNLDPPFIL